MESTKLTKTDRCDACTSAEAVVKVGKPRESEGALGVSELMFCSHHYNRSAAALHLDGWELTHDQREHLDIKPGASA
jgi:hypothetical protein